jgi:hypothetical protein
VALIRTDVSEVRIASIFRVHECEQVTERSCKLLYNLCHLPEDDNHHDLKSLIAYSSVAHMGIVIGGCILRKVQVTKLMRFMRSSEKNFE